LTIPPLRPGFTFAKMDVSDRLYAANQLPRTKFAFTAIGCSRQDVDGNAEDRRGTISVFNGPAPQIETYDDPEQEAEAVGAWIKGRVEAGVEPHEIGVFVRSSRELRRARNAAKQAGVQAVELSDKIEVTPGKFAIGTMHLAKGLEFRAVAVMACDDEVIPSQDRIENVPDDADLEEVYESERHCSMSPAPAPATVCW
jgi:superfamily I DNA/RNA helicase